MSDPKMIQEIQAAVTIPVMAKVRIGHFVEAQVLSFDSPWTIFFFLNLEGKRETGVSIELESFLILRYSSVK